MASQSRGGSRMSRTRHTENQFALDLGDDCR